MCHWSGILNCSWIVVILVYFCVIGRRAIIQNVVHIAGWKWHPFSLWYFRFEWILETPKIAKNALQIYKGNISVQCSARGWVGFWFGAYDIPIFEYKKEDCLKQIYNAHMQVTTKWHGYTLKTYLFYPGLVYCYRVVLYYNLCGLLAFLSSAIY